MNYLGIDIGGTFIKHGVISGDTGLIYSDKIETATSLEKLLDDIQKLIEENIKQHSIKAAGIGIAGFISSKDRIIIQSPNIPCLDGIPFEEEIKKRTGIPIVVENDANVAAMGEMSVLPTPPQSFVHLTLGTGIGSGIILGGEIWHGECGYAGELGHVTVNPEGRTCGCGNNGCIETEASATGITKTFREHSGNTKSAYEIFKLSKANDPYAKKTFQQAGYYMGIFLSIIINALNPAYISIGGGVARAGDEILLPTLEALKKRINPKILVCTTIKISTLKDDPGIMGAAKLAQLI